MAKYTKAQQSKFAKVMREFYKGELHHGSTGKVVRRADVAKAIAASEAGVSRSKSKKSKSKSKSKRKRRKT